MIRPSLALSCALLSCALLLNLAPVIAHAADDGTRVPLTAIEVDSVYLTNGTQLVGRYIETLANGAIRFEQEGRPTSVIPVGEIRRLERRQTLPEAILRRGDQAIANAEWTEIQRIVRFVLDRPVDAAPPKGDKPRDPKTLDTDVKTAAAQVVTKALATKPTVEVASAGVALAWARQDFDAVVTLSQTGLKADPNWTQGYEHQAKVFQARKQDDRLAALVVAWLDKQPTAAIANRYQAGLAESRGDMRAAAEAYRKCFDLHQDWEAGVGYARCSLRRGDRAEAVRASKTLLEKKQQVGPAHAWYGAALLADNSPESMKAAQGHLEQALSGELDADTANIAHYNLGLIHLRSGRSDDMRKQWALLTGTLASLTAAHVERKPIDPASLPASMAGWVAEHNACINLETKNWQAAAAANLPASTRSVFLGQIGALLKDGGSTEAIRQISATSGEESVRWQVYGHLLQSRTKEAETLIDQLPVTDGWAIAVRIYLASIRKDDAAARTWLKRLEGSTNLPKAYVRILVAEFASANDEVMTETFDWTDPEAVATGWDVAAPGTGITVHAREGRLVLEGTQRAAETTAVYKLEPGERFRSVHATFDSEHLGDAVGGLELLDEARVNGVQAALMGGRLVWRSIDKGQGGPWNQTGLTASSTTAIVHIELERGRLQIGLGDADKVPVSSALGRSERFSVGIFGVGDTGQTWQLRADDFGVQLLPLVRR